MKLAAKKVWNPCEPLLSWLFDPGDGGVLGLIFAGYVPLASQNLYPIIVYSVANLRPHLSHFWASLTFAIPTRSLSIYVSTISIL